MFCESIVLNKTHKAASQRIERNQMANKLIRQEHNSFKLPLIIQLLQELLEDLGTLESQGIPQREFGLVLIVDRSASILGKKEEELSLGINL